MRVFFDENMPRPLRFALAGHEVSYVEREGWKGRENGELLALVATRFDFILTSDGSIGYQNSLSGRNLSMIVVPTNNLTRRRANAIAIRETLDEIDAMDRPVVITIDGKGRRTVQTVDPGPDDVIRIAPVPPFEP